MREPSPSRGGTSTLTATTTTANFLVNGGTLGVKTNETVSGSFSGTGGAATEISLASGMTLKLTGAASFDTTSAYGLDISGPGTLSTTGPTTLATQTGAYVDLYLSGGATWTNSGTATIGGQIDFGVVAVDHASFVNQAGGVFNLIDDFAGIVAYTSYDTATFTNAGLLEKTAGTATSVIDATVTNTGSIAVASGTMAFFAGGSFGGTISGAGTIAFSGGTSTLSVATTTANLLVNGGTLNVSTNELISGLAISSGTLAIAAADSITVPSQFSGTGGLISLASGAKLAVTGAAGFDTTNAYGPTISGPGTLSTTGATTLTAQTGAYVDLYLAGGASWTNSGTATIGGQIDFGVTGADTAAFVNQAGAVFNLTDDFASIVPYTSYDTATFNNAGLLEKSGGTLISSIYATVTNTGSIAVASGTMAFFGGGSLGGSISGAGTVAFSGGTSTLTATTTTANFLLNGGTLAISKSETVTGPFSANSGLITLASAATLKLTAPSFDTTNAYGPEIIRTGYAQHLRHHHPGDAVRGVCRSVPRRRGDLDQQRHRHHRRPDRLRPDTGGLCRVRQPGWRRIRPDRRSRRHRGIHQLRHCHIQQCRPAGEDRRHCRQHDRCHRHQHRVDRGRVRHDGILWRRQLRRQHLRRGNRRLLGWHQHPHGNHDHRQFPGQRRHARDQYE